MQSKIEDLENTKKKIWIELRDEELEKEWDRVYKELSSQVNIPGFRSGNIPPQILKKRFKDLAERRLIETVVPRVYEEIIRDKELEPLEGPLIGDVDLKDNCFKFSITVRVKPVFDPKGYRNIPLRVRDIRLEPEEIEQFLKILKEKFKTIQTIELPPYEEEKRFFQSLGCKDKEDLENLLKSQIFLLKFESRKQELYSQVREYLLKENKSICVPQSILERNRERILEENLKTMRERGMSEEDIKKAKVSLQERIKSEVEKQLKLHFILENIAKKEGIAVSSDENLIDRVVSFIWSQAELK